MSKCLVVSGEDVAIRDGRNERTNRNERNDTNRTAGGEVAKGIYEKQPVGLCDTYVRSCPLAVTSPILYQMGSRAGRRRESLESIAEARIDNVSFETEVSDVELNNEERKAYNTARSSTKISKFHSKFECPSSLCECAAESISKLHMCEIGQKQCLRKVATSKNMEYVEICNEYHNKNVWDRTVSFCVELLRQIVDSGVL